MSGTDTIKACTLSDCVVAAIILQDFRAVFMGTKSCTKILIFSTRFSCENVAVDYFVTFFMGKKSCDGEMFCLGMVLTNLYMLFYAGGIQNSKCRTLKWQRIFS